MRGPQPYEKASKDVPAEARRPSPLRGVLVIIALLAAFGAAAAFVATRTDTLNYDGKP